MGFIRSQSGRTCYLVQTAKCIFNHERVVVETEPDTIKLYEQYPFSHFFTERPDWKKSLKTFGNIKEVGSYNGIKVNFYKSEAVQVDYLRSEYSRNQFW